jgi:hypothetical protein
MTICPVVEEMKRRLDHDIVTTHTYTHSHTHLARALVVASVMVLYAAVVTW